MEFYVLLRSFLYPQYNSWKSVSWLAEYTCRLMQSLKNGNQKNIFWQEKLLHDEHFNDA